jgi:hypothetical protein
LIARCNYHHIHNTYQRCYRHRHRFRYHHPRIRSLAAANAELESRLEQESAVVKNLEIRALNAEEQVWYSYSLVKYSAEQDIKSVRFTVHFR